MEDINPDHIAFNNANQLPYTDHNNELINDVNKLADRVSKSLANIFPDFQNIAKDVLVCVNEAVDQFITSENSSIPTDTIRKEFERYLSYKDTNNDYINYKTDNITYKQFIHWFEDKSYSFLHRKLQDILDTINNKEYRNTNWRYMYNVKVMSYQLVQDIKKYFSDFYNSLTNNNKLKLLEQCCIKETDNNNAITLADSIKEGIKKLENLENQYFFISVQKIFESLNDTDNNLRDKFIYSRNIIGKIIENDSNLLDSNLETYCTNLLVALYHEISKLPKQTKDINNLPEYLNLVYKFGQYYSSITAHLSQEEISNIIEDYSHDNPINGKAISNLQTDIKYSRKDLNQNTNGIFNLNVKEGKDITLKQLLQYFSNKMTIPVLNMIDDLIIRIVGTGKYWPSNEQEFNTLVTKSIVKCIEEIKHIAHHAVVFLKNDKKFNKAFGNTNVTETITNSIAGGIDQLDSLIK